MVFSATTTGDEVVKAFASEVEGKTFLITGPSESGVGAETAIFLAAGKPELIVLAGRTKSKIQPVIDEIKSSHPDVKTLFVQLDLADNSSVRAAAKVVNDSIDKLDVLINNAGIMALKEYAKSKDGIEMQLAANHTGHFLLTNLLMPKLLAAKGARIINVSSFGYMSGGIRFNDPNFKASFTSSCPHLNSPFHLRNWPRSRKQDGAGYNPWIAYAQSKTANILFATALAEKVKSKRILAFSLNPGLIFDSKLMTNVSPEMFADGHRIATAALTAANVSMPSPAMNPKSLAAGAATSLYAALAPELEGHNGAFLVNAQMWTEPLMEHATGLDKAERLWAVSEGLVGEEFA
ncbi:hypothetical protein MMC30_006912, partial [Trapelia coarctata]|nr:hypothetical protein [Trapelia coarctata]